MSQPESPLQPWLFQAAPYPEESFSHFLGRFRRANCLSSAQLSTLLGQRSYIVSYWESPSRQRRPDKAQLAQLSQLTGVAIARLQSMWSPSAIRLHWPTRLCPDCYAEAPWHRFTWQRADQPDCERHQRSLISACPDCHHGFQLPSYWATGACDRCRRPFAQMGLELADPEKTRARVPI